MASDVETSQESQAASGESDLWAVTEILAEKGNKYRVQWDGTDPETGEPWPPSWIPKTYATQGESVRLSTRNTITFSLLQLLWMIGRRRRLRKLNANASVCGSLVTM